MSSPIRIGIVGPGRVVAEEHVPRFRSIRGVELTTVAARSPGSAHKAAQQLGIPKTADHWRGLVSDPEIDAVLVGSWPYLHAPVAITALNAGKHVLTEARMASTSEEASEMLEVSLRHPELVAMVVPASFSLWADATIRRLVQTGPIGRLRHVRVTWDASAFRAPAEFWRWQRRYSGQNVMALGIVYESMVRWLGAAQSVTANTRLDEPWREGPDGPVHCDVPDHLLALIDFPDDVTAVLDMSARFHRFETNRALLFGIDGVISVDFKKQSIELARRGRRPRLIEVRDEDRAESTVEADFVAAIRGEQRQITLSDFATGLEYMTFVAAVEQSAAEGRQITVR